jgi:hypothetical protein
MILFHEGPKLYQNYLKLIIGFVKLNIRIRWTSWWLDENGRSESRLMPVIPRQSSIRYLLNYSLRIGWTKSQVSLSHDRAPASTNLPTLGFWVSCIFTNCEMLNFGIGGEKPFWGILIQAVAHSSRLQKSSGRSFEMVSEPSLFCDSSGRVSILPVFGPLIAC